MKELTSEQAIKIAESFYNALIRSIRGRILSWKEIDIEVRAAYVAGVVAIVPLVQLPLDEPTPEELKNFETRIGHHAGAISYAVKNVLGEFIQSRNRSRANPPEDPRREKMRAVLREQIFDEKECEEVIDTLLAAIEEENDEE